MRKHTNKKQTKGVFSLEINHQPTAKSKAHTLYIGGAKVRVNSKRQERRLWAELEAV